MHKDDPLVTSVSKSMELYNQASKLIPGATQLISRRPTRYAYGITPAYASSARGARFTDVDGNRFIDWVSGIGAVILGYCDSVVDESVKRQIDLGTMYSVSHPIEIELAELLIKRIPCAEMVRFAKGGGDACAVAIRIARGTTGRNKILFSGYHGWHDWYLAANHKSGELDSHLFPGIDPIGVPVELSGTVLPFPYDDLDFLETLLEDNREDTAAIIMEPLRSEFPSEGYLSGVRQLADKFDVLLIFDEVSTGFRPTDSGVQPLVGVTPDMAVFAKSLSNGYPMGAVVGTRKAMQPAAQMFISSTYWSDTIGIRAAITTLEELSIRNSVSTIHNTGQILKTEISQLLQKYSLPAVCDGVDWHPYLRFHTEDNIQLINTLYIQEMAKRSVHTGMSFYINESHGESELSETLGAVEAVFTILRKALDNGQLHDLVETIPQTDGFRRLVR
ncbi:MAG: aminotransferase class III [Planctomycetaceae bacterium]|nr:aminotransferase class III [Planctomycetaceae bacterium]